MNENQVRQIKRLMDNERLTNFVNIDIDIFDELKHVSEIKVIKSHRQQSFTFSYLWLISYLWKYSKYKKEKFDTQDIKETLGLFAREKSVDYIIKRNGVLDVLKYTETTRNFPIQTNMRESRIEVLCLSNLDEQMRKEFLGQYHSRYFCKKPLNQYERAEKNLDGLMFSKDRAIKITLEEFTKIILTSNSVNAFQLYAYLKMRSRLLGYKPVKIYLAELAHVLGCSEQTIMRNTATLKELDMINADTTCKSVQGKVSKDNSYSINIKYQN